ncbi:DUF3147 family protein [Oecophyllibacter saccharovorans]|uniref:DUF3147 family protein n=1 Tax=Oecophyllibacter saccharovorans TaxID=2558360 RepID=UPI0011748049|nr:DUF3147 family protein [Oecophyllibacter saccharovorans]TPW33772.1 DUF3147 family protein [Oecophyllibacter saccharovorans]
MLFVLKAALSGILIALVAGVSRRYPGAGALIASLPLISVLGMVWLWLEKPDRQLMETHVGATFWYILPSLPMFLLIPLCLRHGMNFWLALACGCLLTVVLYVLLATLGARWGLKL